MIAVTEGVIRRDLTDKALNQITSGTQALLKTPQVKSDIYLIAAYHKYFLFSQFACLQKGDPFIGEKAGFLSRHIAGRYFRMHSDLVVALKDDGWKEIVDFQPSCDNLATLPDTERRIQTTKMQIFLRIALKQLVKHFDVWMNKLLFLSIFAEVPLSQRTARYLLGRRDPELQIISEYASTINNRTINFQEYSTFVAQRCNSCVQILTSYHVQPRMHDLRGIADGGNMWSTSPCHQLLVLRRHYYTKYAAIASNSHLAESKVKDANH